MTALLPWGNADRTRIGRLRVRGGTESTSLRLGLSGLLDRADLRPPGVPPAAVLIVRRMGDPLPGRLAPGQRVGSVDLTWERAARDRLAGFYRRAARPGRDPVPADADAVAFADEGELLASLVLDLVRGRMRERWWWRSLTGSLPLASPSALASLLCSRAVLVPAALAQLARQDRAVEIVRALSLQEALSVLTVVSQVHGVSALAAMVTSPRAPLTTSGAAAPPSASGGTSDYAPSEDGSAAVVPASPPAQRAAEPEPPWSKWLPHRSVPAELERARACLLGVSLALHHRPEAVRRASFAMGLRRWWQARETALVRSTPPPRPTSGPGQRTGRVATEGTGALALRSESVLAETMSPPQPPPPAVPPAAPPPSLPSAVREPPSQRPPAQQRAGDAPDAAPPDAMASSHAASRESVEREAMSNPVAGGSAAEQEAASSSVASGLAMERESAPDRLALPPAGEDTATPPSETVLPVIDDPLPAAATILPHSGLVLEDGVDTALGGMLFLINAMCALDLPECFEEGWRLASTVGACGVLEALGRALLGSDAGNAGDLIWPTLAALSGRGVGDRLGAGLPRRAAYRLPAAWAAQMPADGNEPQAWAARGGKLRLWSRAGYVLSETLRDASPAVVQARCEAQRWGLLDAPPRARFGDAPLAAWSGPPIAGLDHALRRWLSLAVPFIRLRLVHALGIDPAEESLQEALLARVGRLYVTATHVDLVMGLETVSLPARIAGLDRSPGWLGEFGRVILFHFE
jgi:hypothetical protein